MTAYTFDMPFDEPISPQRAEENAYRRRLQEIADSLREGARQMKEEEERRAALPQERLISLKMPAAMLERLDLIAQDADISRSQLIRQIASDFLNYVWANGIKFRGSLMGFKHRPITDRDDDEHYHS